MDNLPAVQENILNEFVFYFWTYNEKENREIEATPNWPWRMHRATFQTKKREYMVFSPEITFKLEQENKIFKGGIKLEEIYHTIIKEKKIPGRYKPIIQSEDAYSRYYKDCWFGATLFSMRMPYQILSILEQRYPEKREAIELLRDFSAKTGITFDEAVENLYKKVCLPMMKHDRIS